MQHVIFGLGHAWCRTVFDANLKGLVVCVVMIAD